MNKIIKKTLKIVLPILLGGFILYWVYRDFDFERAKEVLLHGTDWGWMLLSLLFGVLSHVLRGWRWRQTLEPLGAYPKRSDCVDAIFISYAANLMLPRVGEVSRCGVLVKYDDVSFSKSLGTVVTERLVDTLCILLITGLTFMAQMPVFLRFFQETGTKIPSLMHLLTSPWFYVSLFSVIGVLVLAYYLMRMLSFFEKVKGVVLNVCEGVMSLRNVKNIPLFVFYTLSIWGCYFYHFYLTFYCFSFTEHLSFQAAMVMFVGGTFAVIVPTPNGAGPWHFAVITMMMLYGVSATDAGIFALIVYNNLHGIVPRQAIKSGRAILSGDELRHGSARYDLPGAKTGCAADPVAAYMTDRDIESAIKIARAAMESAARELDFTAAAAYRDQMYALQEKQKSMQKK